MKIPSPFADERSQREFVALVGSRSRELYRAAWKLGDRLLLAVGMPSGDEASFLAPDPVSHETRAELAGCSWMLSRAADLIDQYVERLVAGGGDQTKGGGYDVDQ